MTKNSMRKSIVLLSLLALGLATLPACREKGPGEKAGEKIDKAVDDTKDKVKEGVDKAEDKLNK